MIPLLVTATLRTPPIFGHRSGPLLLDAPLIFGLGCEMGAAHPSGLVAADDVIAASDAGEMPLARVEWGSGLWGWACSQVTPWGEEAVQHLHRRAPLSDYERWTKARSVNVGAGPDKALRVPHYRRIEMLRLRWRCIGDPERIRALLAPVAGVGKLVGAGNGAVASWEVEDDPDPIPLSQYAHDVQIRPVPLAAVPVPDAPAFARHDMPLRAPYHRQDCRVPCWRVPEEA